MTKIVDKWIGESDEKRIYGYARVSTEDQNLDMQTRALNEYGCKFVFEEKRSAFKVKRRQFDLLKLHLQRGDTLVVWKLDRLGRDIAELIEFMAMLEKREVNFVSLQDHIDTRTAMGKFIFHLMAALAQLERDLISERTKAGMTAAKARGWKPGPRPLIARMDAKTIRDIKKDLEKPNMSWMNLHKKYGFSVTTLRKYFLEYRREAQMKALDKETE